MTTNETRYGFHLSRDSHRYPGDPSSIESITLRVVAKRDDEEHPRGLTGHELDGFQLFGHVHESTNFGPGIIGFVPEYHSVFSTKLRDAQAQLRLLRRCDKALIKAFDRFGYSRDGNSYLIAATVAEALNLSFFCEDLAGPSPVYASGNWKFYDITNGVSRVESLEQEAITAFRLSKSTEVTS